mmetsp:Transcript_11984/g.21206  ORF Transcript_11984/g.21206 Transcript_11984/m.21206 type:complete len:121 (-) Transcript_11984:2480-2842(-)
MHASEELKWLALNGTRAVQTLFPCSQVLAPPLQVQGGSLRQGQRPAQVRTRERHYTAPRGLGACTDFSTTSAEFLQLQKLLQLQELCRGGGEVCAGTQASRCCVVALASSHLCRPLSLPQ